MVSQLQTFSEGLEEKGEVLTHIRARPTERTPEELMPWMTLATHPVLAQSSTLTLSMTGISQVTFTRTTSLDY